MSIKIIHNEECRIIKDFERYYISESGQIYRCVPVNKVERKLLKDGAEYISKSKLHFRLANGKLRQAFCSLTNANGKLFNLAVAPLVAMAFNVIPYGFNGKKQSIEFIDGNLKNLHYTNLKLSDKKFGRSKLTSDDVKKIRHLIRMKYPLKHIAELYNVSEMQISRINSGENWGNGKRRIKAPVAPFAIEDGKIRKYIATFNREKAPEDIRKPFTIKRNKNVPTDNVIIGILKGYKLTLKHQNITRARENVKKLNDYFF